MCATESATACHRPRFIRHYLYQGFNADERGRPAFDGFFVHTAGAGREASIIACSTSRDAQPYHVLSDRRLPFTSVPARDPVTRQSAGLRDNMRGTNATKVFYVNGGHEYWGRAASLTQTTPDGKQDVGFLANERRYVISSAQHSSPSGWPLADSAKIGTTNAYRGDPLDQRLALRALMSSLIDWVTLQKDPPTPMYPTFAQETLVSAASLHLKIPKSWRRIRINPSHEFRSALERGIIDREPPTPWYAVSGFRLAGGLVGNEPGGTVYRDFNVATGHPWQLRTGMPAGANYLVSFANFILAQTEADRKTSGDRGRHRVIVRRSNESPARRRWA
jgi:hypothetical protein